MPFASSIGAPPVTLDAFGGIIDNTISGELSVPGITKLRKWVLYQCEGLTRVSFPDVTLAEECALRDCYSLLSVEMPNLVEAQDLFLSGCRRLVSVSFPKLERLTFNAFYGCNSLTTANFPALVSISRGAFSQTPLESLTLGASTVCALENTNAFYRTKIESGEGRIYVPAALVADYKTATNWSVFADQIEAI